MKQVVTDSRFDFRGGRNTAISPDLLNPNELVDCTNARLSQSYGGFVKRSGSQRIHSNPFPGPVNGVTQWDTPNGKQTVVISGGALFWRNGYSFNTGFTQVPSPGGVMRSTANQGVFAGWFDDAALDQLTGVNSISGVAVNTSQTLAAANRMFNKLGDPAIDNNIIAGDQLYTVKFKLIADGTGLHESFPPGDFNGASTSSIQFEYSSDNGATWNPVGGIYEEQAGLGEVNSVDYSVALQINATGFPHLWIRLILSVGVGGVNVSGTGAGSVQIFETTYKNPNFPVTWTSGGVVFSTTQPAIFAPFRASSSGAPLTLYIASGGHYFSWDGVATVTQLDGTNQAPLATSIIAYHTRMFAMSASDVTPGLLPKTIFWSTLGNATDFTTGDKTKGGSAVTDFLTGQQLTALEVIGSSLLMATRDSVMRFTGHASDDIVIAQDTEGISAEIGASGLLALKRYENVAAMMTDRGPYTVTETYAQPSGEQLNPDWQGLDNANLSKVSIEYHRARKELLFAVPGATDGGTPKTVFSQAVRLQAWQGPWIYPFTIACMGKWFDANGNANVISGGNDGWVRLMDVGLLDDVQFDGSGGSTITMTVEIPVIHFGSPGLKKALKWIMIQGSFPTGSTPVVNIAFDGGAFTPFPFAPNDNGEEDYRVDVAGDTSQGFRCRMQFVDASPFQVAINGFTLQGWNMQRNT